MSSFKLVCLIVALVASFSFSALAGEGHIIKDVPFYPQEKHQCGPATLAGALNFYGERLAPSDISGEIFDRKRKGTLNLDMLIFAKKRGYQVQPIHGSLANLKYYISQDMPVIVYIRAPKKHFALAIGYGDGKIVLNSGTTERKTVPEGLFKREWKIMGRWALVIAPKDRTLPKTIDELIDVAMGLENEGKLAEAVKAFEKVLERDPQNLTAHIGRGNSYLGLKQYDEAAGAFEEARKLRPRNPAILNNLAWAEMERGYLKEAERLAKRALKYSRKKRKNRHYYQDTLGTIYLRKGNIRYARKHLKAALNQAPDSDKTFIAEVLKKLENIEAPDKMIYK